MLDKTRSYGVMYPGGGFIQDGKKYHANGTPMESEGFACADCGKSFATEKALSCHRSKAHVE